MSVFEVSDELASLMRTRAAAQGQSIELLLRDLLAKDLPALKEEKRELVVPRLAKDASEPVGSDSVTLSSVADAVALMNQVVEELSLEMAAEGSADTSPDTSQTAKPPTFIASANG